MQEKASIIILTYNNLDYTRMCLESIYAVTDAQEFEVVVVDNASQDKTPQFLQEFAKKHSNMQLVLSPVNHGFPKGNNVGAAAATGNYLVFLNNDTIVTEGWLTGLIRHLRDPLVGMVGPVTNSSGNETRILVEYENIQDMPAFARQYTRAHAGQSFEIPMLPLQCVAIRRKVFEQVGPLDEMFGLGMFEDDDYALRIKQQGFRILCAEDVFIHHWGSASFSRLHTGAYYRLFNENRQKFEQKWGVTWHPHLLRTELLPVQVEQFANGSLWLANHLILQEAQIQELVQTVNDLKMKLDEQSSSALGHSVISPVAVPTEAGSGFTHRLVSLLIRALQVWLEVGTLAMLRRSIGRIQRSSYYQRLKAWIYRIPPAWLKKFYAEFQISRPFIDRSEVVLFADPEILPGYARRALLAHPQNEVWEPVKVSLIATVRNEASTSQEWLSSLAAQSRLPDEVVIVDGGSTDGTVGILKEVASTYPVPLLVIEAPGANISQGRNLAILNAQHAIIACTDFGCVLDKNWLHNLVLPFEIDPKIEASAGFYEAITFDTFDRIGARFFVNKLDTIDPQTFLPSARSLAMKKSFWARVGGYPEWLTDAGEDTAFDLQAKSQPARWAFVPQAKVFWRPPRFFLKMFRTIHRYSIGDGEAGTFAASFILSARRLFKLYLLRALFLLLFILSFFLGVWGWWLLLALGVTWLARSLLSIYRVNKLRKQGVFRAILHLWIEETVHTARLIGFARGVTRREIVRNRQAAQFTGQVEQILALHRDRKGPVIYPPTHDWGFMFQRPHQMARAFAHKGYLFFYCTNNEITDSVVGFQEVEPGLYVCQVPANTFQQLHQPVVYLGAAWHRSRLPFFDDPVTIYDHYDDLEVSSATPADHHYLLKQADIVLVTSERLLTPEMKSRNDVLLVPNGVDYERIQQDRPGVEEPLPEDWEPIAARKRPVIGYAGALASWFDYELIAAAARARPELEFVLIGVNYDHSLDQSNILQIPNVHWLGMKPYNELFRYVWRFDVGVIPFCINNITLATSPIKMFEYMACRKPVVTTALPECRRYQGVMVAENRDEFITKLDDALNARQDENYLAILDQTARQNTWESRVDEIIARLQPIQGQPKSKETV